MIGKILSISCLICSNQSFILYNSQVVTTNIFEIKRMEKFMNHSVLNL